MKNILRIVLFFTILPIDILIFNLWEKIFMNIKFLLFIILSLFVFQTVSVYALNQDEETLLDASIFGDDDVVEKILAKNINVNIQDDVGNTALILASMEGHTKVVALLLQSDADKSIVNKHGNNALFYAKERNHRNVIKLLE